MAIIQQARYGGMTFQFDNNLEMKVRTKGYYR